MFEIKYKIVDLGDEEGFKGDYGFFKFICNGISYGSIFVEDLINTEGISKEELEKEFADSYVYDWIERFIRVAEKLRVQDTVTISDTDSYCVWIEFICEDEFIVINLLREDKFQDKFKGIYDLVDGLIRPCEYEWKDQRILKSEFEGEIIRQAKNYIKEIEDGNVPKSLLEDLKNRVNHLESV